MQNNDVPPYLSGSLSRRLAAAAATMLFGGIALAEPDNNNEQAKVLADCEQTDSAPLVVRACTNILNQQNLEPAERKRILILRGVGWSKEDEFAAAAEDFTAAIEIDPANIAALEGRAKAHSKLAEHSKSAVDHRNSAEDWSQLVALQPQNDKYYRLRGNERLAAGQHQEALADFDKSLEINPKAVDAYIGRAHVYHSLKERQLAEKEFKKGIEVNDNYLPLHWARAEMAEHWGEEKLAIESYVKVLKINGVYEDARRRLQRLGVFTPP